MGRGLKPHGSRCNRCDDESLHDKDPISLRHWVTSVRICSSCLQTCTTVVVLHRQDIISCQLELPSYHEIDVVETTTKLQPLHMRRLSRRAYKLRIFTRKSEYFLVFNLC